MEACYGGTDVMERSCAVARGIDTNTRSRFVFVSGFWGLSSWQLASVVVAMILYKCGYGAKHETATTVPAPGSEVT